MSDTGLESLKVVRAGKDTVTGSWFEAGQAKGRILRLGAGIFLSNEFSSIEEAKTHCEQELETDPSLMFYVMRGDDLIEVVMDESFHVAKQKKENRVYASASAVIVMLLALGVSLASIPFQEPTHILLFVLGAGLIYGLLYAVGGNWHLESVLAAIVFFVVVAVFVSLLIDRAKRNEADESSCLGLTCPVAPLVVIG